MNRVTQLYTAVLIAVAVLAVASISAWTAMPMLSSAQSLALVTLVALGIFSETVVVQIAVDKNHQAGSSIAFVPLFGALLILPAPYQIVVTLLTFAVAQFGIHKRPPLRAGFNIAQIVIAMTAASAVFTSLGGRPGDAASVTVVNFAALAGTFFLTNHSLVAIAVALLSGERFGRALSRIASISGANLFYDILTSPIAIVVAVLYIKVGVGGIFLVFFPLLLVRHAYGTIQKLQSANKDVLQVLVKTIETRDPYTSGHSLRVAQMARVIAQDLDLSPFKVEMIETAGMVHDIGKIDSLYADLIGKESGLTEAERRVIMTHAAKGAEFLRTLSSLPETIVLAVRHHHERYDGTGYPDRLAGEEIPLASRIIMLCDSVDAMLSDRPYRRALTVEQVRAELLRCSGAQFDPRIVQVMLKRNTLERAASLVTPTAKKPNLSVAV